MSPELKSIFKSFLPPLFFIGLLWIVFGFQTELPVDLHEFGVYPRAQEGLLGILTMPFVHDDLKHIFSNTIPLFILGACLTFFYREIAFKTFIGVWLLDGIWLWMGGRPSWHIGASGIVYGLATFLLLSGMLRRERRLMAVSMLVIFLYGGMVWGLFPLFFGVSWEAHLFGALAGILLAFAFRKEGPQRIPYVWEDEPDEEPTIEEGQPEEFLPEAPQPADPIVKINYDYKEEKEE